MFGAPWGNCGRAIVAHQSNKGSAHRCTLHVVVDADDNIIIAGSADAAFVSAWGGLDDIGAVFQGGSRGVVAKLASDGSLRWLRMLGDDLAITDVSVFADTGVVVVVGNTVAAIDHSEGFDEVSWTTPFAEDSVAGVAEPTGATSDGFVLYLAP